MIDLATPHLKMVVVAVKARLAAVAMGDIFEDIFGEMMGGGRRSSGGRSRGADLRYNMEISLEDAFAGKTAEIEIPASVTCEKCEGSGAKPGTSPSTCNTCGGAGQVRASQGFFLHSTHLPLLPRPRRSHYRPLFVLFRLGQYDRKQNPFRQRALPVLKTEPGFVLRARARPEHGVGRKAICIFSCRSARMNFFSAMAPTSIAGSPYP